MQLTREEYEMLWEYLFLLVARGDAVILKLTLPRTD